MRLEICGFFFGLFLRHVFPRNYALTASTLSWIAPNIQPDHGLPLGDGRLGPSDRRNEKKAKPPRSGKKFRPSLRENTDNVVLCITIMAL